MASITRARKPARSQEQIRHDHYLTQAQLIRDARLFKMPAGVRRASFTLNGEHVDMYASKEYRGYGYRVTCGAAGYECGCEQFANRHDGCVHTRDASARAKARYESAKRQNEMDGARVVAPIVLGEISSDLQAHLEDEMPAQDDAFERVYRALVFGTTNTLDNIMQRAHLVEPDLATNALEVLRANGRIIVRKVERGVFWVDTPDQAYRSAYYGDYAA